MKSNFIKDALALCIITLVAGVLLGFVYELTKGPIEEAALKAKLAAYEAVFEGASIEADDALTAKIASPEYASALSAAGVEKATVMEAYKALDASGNLIGYVMTTDSTAGYAGQISISVGMKVDGSVTGMEFLVLNETQGFGSKAANPEHKEKYVGFVADSFKLGDNVDAISGATVSSKAVNNAMNAALVFVKQLAQ